MSPPSGREADHGERAATWCDERTGSTGDEDRCRRRDAVDEGLRLLGDRGGAAYLGPPADRQQEPVGEANRVRRHQVDHRGDVAAACRGQERLDDVTLFGRGIGPGGFRPVQFHPGTTGQFLRRGHGHLQGGDLVERDREQVVEDVGDPLPGRQLVEQHLQRPGHVLPLENSAAVGLDERWLPSLAVLEGLGVAGLVLGLPWIPPLGLAAAVALVLFLVVAIVVHCRERVLSNLAFPSSFPVLAVAATGYFAMHSG